MLLNTFMTILLIDDNSEEHSLFELALKRINVGSQYYSASSCDEALDSIFSRSIAMPDFIFLDIDMPEIDGNGCLSMLKAQSNTRDLAVILYSTKDHEEQISYMLKHGAVCHLDKSRSFEKFCRELKTILTSQAAS